jgi:hypothetical protein
MKELKSLFISDFLILKSKIVNQKSKIFLDRSLNDIV